MLSHHVSRFTSLLITAYLVLVVPAAWNVARLQPTPHARAAVTNLNEEEREEHNQAGSHYEQVSGDRPRNVGVPWIPVVIVLDPIAHDEDVAGSIAPPLHPGRFSVRRLI